MTSGGSTVATTEPVADARAVARVIKDKPPVPLLREEIEVIDRFGSLDVAKGLADVIEKVEPPFTISISGSWGVGKTTLAKQLRARLEAHVPHAARVRCVEIDLWAEDIADLRRRVALEVAVELEDHQSPKERDKALKCKAVEFDDQLRKAQIVQERPKVTVPLIKSNPWLAVLLFAVLIGGISFLWDFTTPSDPSIEATGAKAVVRRVTEQGPPEPGLGTSCRTKNPVSHQAGR